MTAQQITDKLLQAKLSSWFSYENDGIGYYDYTGAKCYDAGTNYIEGGVELDITGIFKSKADFMAWMISGDEEQVMERIQEHTEGTEVEWIDKFEINDELTKMYFNYTAGIEY